MGMEWKGGSEDSTGSVTVSSRGPDIGSLYPGNHQPQYGHLPPSVSLVGSPSHIFTSGLAKADAVPWKAGHPGFPSRTRLVVWEEFESV